MRVIILAAGYATRLFPLTLNTPKPLLSVGGRTILDRIVEKAAALKGVSGIAIVSNERFFKNFSEWAARSKYKDGLSVINDGTATNETRLGAIRDLELAIDRQKIDDDVLVIAGDNLFELDLEKFLEFAVARTDGVSFAVHDIGDIALAGNFGVVKIDGSGRVVDFEEKPKNPKSTLISTGIYYFPKNKLPKIKEYVKLRNKLDAPGYYISWLAKNDAAYGFGFEDDWYDIGNIESLKSADAEYSKKERGQDGKA